VSEWLATNVRRHCHRREWPVSTASEQSQRNNVRTGHHKCCAGNDRPDAQDCWGRSGRNCPRDHCTHTDRRSICPWLSNSTTHAGTHACTHTHTHTHTNPYDYTVFQLKNGSFTHACSTSSKQASYINDNTQEVSTFHCALTVVDKFDTGREASVLLPCQQNDMRHSSSSLMLLVLNQ